MKNEPFDKLLEEYKLDCIKLSKGVAAMIWSLDERVARSLDGMESNRFDTAAKAPATPLKVNTVLGKHMTAPSASLIK